MFKEQLNIVEAVLFVNRGNSMFRWIVLVFLSTVAATLFIGCATTDTTVLDTQNFIKTTSKSGTVQVAELDAGDVIEVSVEVDGTMEVSRYRANVNFLGIVTLPLVGDVKIGGLNLDIARSVIAKRYGVYFVTEPVIMLSRADDDSMSEWGQVTVLGRVSQPGVFPLPSSSGIKLSAAIQAAGGFASSAKANDVRISRIDDYGNKVKVSVNFNEIGESGNAEADIKLKDGDIVFVPERIF